MLYLQSFKQIRMREHLSPCIWHFRQMTKFYPRWKCVSPRHKTIAKTFVMVCSFVYFIYLMSARNGCFHNKHVTIYYPCQYPLKQLLRLGENRYTLTVLSLAEAEIFSTIAKKNNMLSKLRHRMFSKCYYCQVIEIREKHKTYRVDIKHV